MNHTYLVIAYYHFAQVEDPRFFVKEHKRFFKDLDVAGRIYISKEGINGQMSGAAMDVESYMAWLKEQPRVRGSHF